MTTSQLNARIDDALKRRGDDVLARHGVSSTTAIRGLWSYLAKSRTLPDFLLAESAHDLPMLDAADQGAGIALRVAQAKGLHCHAQSFDYEEVKKAAYLQRLQMLGIADGNA